MTQWTLLRRSLRYHARSHVGVWLGAVVGSAALIGALVVGDSVRESLREQALARLGKIHLAMATGDRLFGAELSHAISLNESYNLSVSSLVLLGTATAGDNTARASQIQVIGAGDHFWMLANMSPPFTEIPFDAVVLNRPLAEQLRVKPGDSLILRISKINQLSRDAPFTPAGDESVAFRLAVHAIAADGQLGRFSLRANQVAPYNAFVRLDQLQSRIGATNRANLLLLGTISNPQIDAAQAGEQLRKGWQLADAELELRELPELGVLELRSRRVFLDPPAVDAALKAAADARRVQTYFVNELRVGERAVPYSMVTGMSAPVVPEAMRDDEILVNQWLADDLKAKPGDTLTLRYFVVGTTRALEERTNAFRIRAVVPMTLPYADRDLLPDFPGLARAESTRDWDASLPIQVSRIRPQDEQYWKDWRGTPKAFVTVRAGEQMWSNRFGVFTAVRFPIPGGTTSTSSLTDRNRAGVEASPPTAENRRRTLEGKILANLDPASVGLRFEAVREQALKAAAQSQDFGGLFLGFSFFLIVAALLLVALLFQLSLEQRASEVGTLLALGIPPRQVRRWLLLEGTAIAFLGGVVGVFGGTAYARAMVQGLTSIWRDAVGAAALSYHATATSLAMGLAASTLIGAGTIWLTLRHLRRRTARELLAEGAEERGWRMEDGGWKRRRNAWIAGVSATGAASLVGWALWRQETGAAGVFFGAGALLLVAGLSACAMLLSALMRSERTEKLSLPSLGLRSCARRRKRTLAAVGLLACGSFLVAAIGVFRLDANQNAERRSSGTGGFALIGETSLPVVHDLNTQRGREFFGLDERAVAEVSFVPFRVREGDDASCLNLNRAQRPRLLGVKPEALAGRGAFSFAKMAKGMNREQGWRVLDRASSESRLEAAGRQAPPEGGTPDEVPAIGDLNSILWALGKKVGDTLDYVDERGRPFKVRLVGAVANSILQGNLIIDESEFVRRFPGESGYRMFLIDAPSNSVSQVSAALSRAMQDVGLELTAAPRRLAAFNAVQNTYLGTFQVLGGFGLLLGSAGLGVVVLRNVLERRSELALLQAVGFRARLLQWLVLSEHAVLLWLGLGIGVAAALVAVLPSLLSPGAEVPYRSLAMTLGGVLISGMVWTWAAARFALRGRLLAALRNE